MLSDLGLLLFVCSLVRAHRHVSGTRQHFIQLFEQSSAVVSCIELLLVHRYSEWIDECERVNTVEDDDEGGSWKTPYKRRHEEEDDDGGGGGSWKNSFKNRNEEEEDDEDDDPPA